MTRLPRRRSQKGAAVTTKGIEFVSKQTRVREFYSIGDLQDRTFSHIAEDLYNKLLREGKAIGTLMGTRGNELKEEHRVGLVKFFYLNNNIETPIPQAEFVVDFYLNTNVREVLFFIDVIGGSHAGTIPSRAAEDLSHYQFLAHAKELLEEPEKHGKWALKEYGANRFRLVKAIRGRDRNVMTVIMQPTTGYPRWPPRVVTIPTHPDPCFRRGELDWAIVDNGKQFVWELYTRHSNPLVYLIDELKTKYGLVF